jgi:hypothetical protein
MVELWYSGETFNHFIECLTGMAVQRSATTHGRGLLTNGNGTEGQTVFLSAVKADAEENACMSRGSNTWARIR